MSDPRQHQHTPPVPSDQRDTTVRYPESDVLSIIDSREQLEAVTQALMASGFLDAEISATCGQTADDALGANTGRSGLTNLVIPVANRLGLQNEESETKDRYEQALRDKHFVVACCMSSAQ